MPQSRVKKQAAPAKKKRAKVKVPWKDRAKAKAYFLDQPWKIGRLVRVLKSNGPDEAARWAKKHGAEYILRELGRRGIRHNNNIYGGRGTKIGELAAKSGVVN